MLDKIIKKLQDLDSNVFLFTRRLWGFLFSSFRTTRLYFLLSWLIVSKWLVLKGRTHSATLPAILRTTLLVTFAERLPCEQQKYWRFKQVANFWIWKKFDWPKIENVRKVENGSCKMKFDAHWVQVKKGFFVFFLREILSQYCTVYRWP